MNSSSFLCLGITQEEQLLAIRYTFLSLCDESREVLETILRFLLDISIRSGNNQVREQKRIVYSMCCCCVVFIFRLLVGI